MLGSQGEEVGWKWLWDDSAIHYEITEIDLVGERGEVRSQRENKRLKYWFW